jgi:hypothetical protein
MTKGQNTKVLHSQTKTAQPEQPEQTKANYSRYMEQPTTNITDLKLTGHPKTSQNLTYRLDSATGLMLPT